MGSQVLVIKFPAIFVLHHLIQLSFNPNYLSNELNDLTTPSHVKDFNLIFDIPKIYNIYTSYSC
jgi:hypothetical protein